MNWNDLKKKLDNLSEEDLFKPAVFITKCKTQSGVIEDAKKLSNTLYNNYDNDPNPLRTKQELKDMGYDNDDIEDCTIEFVRGDFYIEIEINY